MYTNNFKIIPISEILFLKQIELTDAEDIFATINNEREYLGKWLPFVEYTKTVEDSKLYIKSILDIPAENREYVFVIYYQDTFVGLIGFKLTDKLNRKTEIGYWLSEKYQKKGIITNSVKALMAFAFNELNINRIQIKCAVNNQSSKNIPIGLGYFFEGIERDGELLSNGKFTDIEIYSKLRSEYK